MLQDRATAIAGTLGAGPSMIPINLTLKSDRGTQQDVQDGDGPNDQLFTPLLAYLSILNTLSRTSARTASPATPSAARAHGQGARRRSRSRTCSPAISRRSAPPRTSSAPLNFLLRNSFEDVEIDGLDLDDRRQRAAAQRDARARVARRRARPKPGSTVDRQGAAAHRIAARRSRKSLPVADSGQRARQRCR